MRLCVNATSAHMGGAVTYLRSVLPPLSRSIAEAGGGEIQLWAPRDALNGAAVERVRYRDPGPAADATGAVGIARRLWFDQWELPRRLKEDAAEALFSSANFGTLRSPIRQVLLIRNPVYFDPLIFQRIRARRVTTQYRAQRALALRSIRASDVVLFPTRAMLDMVALYTGGVAGRNWRVAPYGARHDLFRAGPRPAVMGDRVRLLHVSLYCDHKNMGTLFAAMDRLESRSPGRHTLRLTAGFRTLVEGPAVPHLAADREAFGRLEKRGVARDLERTEYGSLPELYRSSDIFVFPSYTESFGHPLVEAMACGLPVVAADVPVNREMCGDAAVYFPPFDPNACADAISSLTDDRELADRLRAAALLRAKEFTWDRHVAVLWDALRGAPVTNEPRPA